MKSESILVVGVIGVIGVALYFAVRQNRVVNQTLYQVQPDKDESVSWIVDAFQLFKDEPTKLIKIGSSTGTGAAPDSGSNKVPKIVFTGEAASDHGGGYIGNIA